MKTILAATLLLLASNAMADTERTAHWYAGHLAEMNSVLTKCHNDPGHLRGSPDCINAEQGLFEWTAAVGMAHLKQQMAADQARREALWASNPRELATQLEMCNGIPRDTRSQQFAHCPEAFAIAKSMLARQK